MQYVLTESESNVCPAALRADAFNNVGYGLICDSS
jgi:hypothetical protein